MSTENGGELGPSRDVVVMGASSDGLVARREIVEALPSELPAAIFVVVHSKPEYGSQLAEIFSGWES
jgi:two-component system chemotaxis response regulator CheB